MKHLKRFNENLDDVAINNEKAIRDLFDAVDKMKSSGDTALHDLFYTIEHMDEFIEKFGYVRTKDFNEDENLDDLCLYISDVMKPLIRRAIGNPRYPARQHQRPNVAYTGKLPSKYVPSWKR